MENSPAFRLIVCDIDGTLIDGTKQVPEFTRDELLRVRAQYGVDCVLASSRMPTSIRLLQQEIEARLAMVAFDGALVLDDSGTVVMEERLPLETARELLRAASDQGVFAALYGGDSWAVEAIGYWALREIRGTKVWPLEGRLSELLDRWNDDGRAVHKIMLRGDEAAIDRICIAFESENEGGTTASRTRPTLVEFSAQSANKARGVQALLQADSLSPADALAFGDGVNDVEMIRLVGQGVAVSNAQTELKAVADALTLSNEEDGVGYWLRKTFPPIS